MATKKTDTPASAATSKTSSVGQTDAKGNTIRKGTDVRFNPDGTRDVTTPDGQTQKLSKGEYDAYLQSQNPEHRVAPGGAPMTPAVQAALEGSRVKAPTPEEQAIIDQGNAQSPQAPPPVQPQFQEIEVPVIIDGVRRTEKRMVPVPQQQTGELGQTLVANAPSVGRAALGGAGVGAGIGATVGSVVPVVGTAAGAAAGGAIGAIGAATGAIISKVVADRKQGVKEAANVYAENKKNLNEIQNRANLGLYANPSDAFADWDRAVTQMRIAQQTLKAQTQQDAKKFIDANAGDELYDVTNYLDGSGGAVAPEAFDRQQLALALLNPNPSKIIPDVNFETPVGGAE